MEKFDVFESNNMVITNNKWKRNTTFKPTKAASQADLAEILGGGHYLAKKISNKKTDYNKETTYSYDICEPWNYVNKRKQNFQEKVEMSIKRIANIKSFAVFECREADLILQNGFKSIVVRENFFHPQLLI